MSLSFLLAVSFLCALFYYICPARFRWIWLLLSSMAIYAHAGWFGVPFILITAGVTWFFALVIERTREHAKAELTRDKASLSREQIKARKEKDNRLIRFLLAIPLLISFGFLALFKYSSSVLHLFGHDGLGLILPLGISFYTFQATGYLFDVYRGNIPAEKNPLRFLLFISFFPQLIQGPIARYNQLSSQLQKEFVFQPANNLPARKRSELNVAAIERGLLLIVWGVFKKKVIADRAAPFVEEVFANHPAYSGGVIVLAVLLYSLQQYCDFSGGIDLITGIAELFGIHLAKNFRQPYFSVSLADFWRRWHISLGGWMRDYVFYPFALSRPVTMLSRVLKKHGRAQLSRSLPAALGNILVFLLVGLWHGASSNYIFWGLYNGLILAFSAILEPYYKSWNDTHPGVSNSKGFHLARILRTFLIVNIGWFFDRAERGTDALSMLAKTSNPFSWKPISADILQGLGLRAYDFRVLLIGISILFVVSFLTERGKDVRNELLMMRLPFRWIILIPFLYFVLATFVGAGAASTGFMYAVF